MYPQMFIWSISLMVKTVSDGLKEEIHAHSTQNRLRPNQFLKAGYRDQNPYSFSNKTSLVFCSCTYLSLAHLAKCHQFIAVCLCRSGPVWSLGLF